MNTADILSTWDNCWKFVANATEDECATLMKAEKKGKRRITFLLRMHSRINVLRATREREELKRTATQ